jgi:hypothetical protein
MKSRFEIVAEPNGQIYFDLLNFAVARCQSFSLVWRDQFKFEQSAHEIKDALQSFQLSSVRTDEWPGTKLIGHQAIVRHYRASDESVKLLYAAGSLYSWLQPKLPEDLAFYSLGGVGWLASISHEGRAWFLDESLVLQELYAHVAGIKIREHIGW